MTGKPYKRKPRHIEKQDAIEHRAEVFATLREQRDAEMRDDEFFQVAQALILCGLSYVPTTATRIIRRARVADGSEVVVVFSSASDAALPYGSDRSLLHFLLDRAVKNQSRFVGWDKAKEFLQAMGMATNSGKNYRDLRKRFERIRGLSIYVRRIGAGSDDSLHMPVIRRAHLPSSIDLLHEEVGQKRLPINDQVIFGVEIGEDFYTELVAHHVPVPAEIIRCTRKASQLQDLMLFLYWRCYAAQAESLIPWKHLQAQLWHDDQTIRRIKVRFAVAIRALKLIWPEMQAEARPDALWVAPPINGRYLHVKSGNSRRLRKLGTSAP